MSTEVTERQARDVAESAREREWKLPSVGKELFPGNFRLELISPQPRLDADATRNVNVGRPRLCGALRR